MKIKLSDHCLRSLATALLLATLPGGGSVRAADLQGNLTVSGEVGVGTGTPATSAQLDVSSTTKGLLPPRMTATQRGAIASPTAGLLVYQTDAPVGLYSYNGTEWAQVGASVSADAILPDQSGNDGKVLTTNGSTVSWGTAAGGGSVTEVSGTSPITVTNGSTTPAISLGTVGVAKGGTGATTAATAAAALLPAQAGNTGKFLTTDGSGVLTWGAAGGGSVTDVTASSPLASSGGTTPNLTLPVASTSADGYLASADWTTFNGKVSSSRSVSTTAPLSGGGALSGDLTLALPVATGSADGYLASADWTTFNGKVSSSRSVSTTAPLSGGGALSGDLTLALPVATGSADGYLASADWTTFNAKESALSFSSPLSRTLNAISLAVATSTDSGYLSSSDWTTFNSKIGGSGTASYLPKFTASGTVGDSALFQDATGKVGIGTATPLRSLHNGSREIIITDAQTGVANWQKWGFYSGADSVNSNKESLHLGILNDVGSAETLAVMHFLASGRVGIGTPTPGYLLDVAGAINGTAITIGGVPVGYVHQ